MHLNEYLFDLRVEKGFLGKISKGKKKNTKIFFKAKYN